MPFEASFDSVPHLSPSHLYKPWLICQKNETTSSVLHLHNFLTLLWFRSSMDYACVRSIGRLVGKDLWRSPSPIEVGHVPSTPDCLGDTFSTSLLNWGGPKLGTRNSCRCISLLLSRWNVAPLASHAPPNVTCYMSCSVCGEGMLLTLVPPVAPRGFSGGWYPREVPLDSSPMSLIPHPQVYFFFPSCLFSLSTSEFISALFFGRPHLELPSASDLVQVILSCGLLRPQVVWGLVFKGWKGTEMMIISLKT